MSQVVNFFSGFIRRILRGLLGFAIGWLLSSIIIMIWLFVGMAFYGDMDRALEQIKKEPFAGIVFGVILAGMTGCVFSAAVALAALDMNRSPQKSRWGVLRIALIAASISAILASSFGLLIADTVHQDNPRSDWVLLMPVGNAALLGIVLGWRIGRYASNHYEVEFQSGNMAKLSWTIDRELPDRAET